MLTEQTSPIDQNNAGRMDFHFLVYLAHMGATDIHPLGRAATGALIAQLDLRPGKRVLEVGCGTGGTMARIAQYGPARVDGVDAILDMLRIARRRLRLLGLGGKSTLRLVEPGGLLPFSDATYDRVYTESVLGFQDEQGAQALLTEINRVLKPGGKYVANEAIWRSGVSAERIAAANAACLADFGVRVASAAPWTLSDWHRIMGDAGFQVISADVLSTEYRIPSSENMTSALGIRRPRLLLSDALTQFYRLRTYLTPAGRRARAYYHTAHKERHQGDGLLIEPRLFVLQKPVDSDMS